MKTKPPAYVIPQAQFRNCFIRNSLIDVSAKINGNCKIPPEQGTPEWDQALPGDYIRPQCLTPTHYNDTNVILYKGKKYSSILSSNTKYVPAVLKIYDKNADTRIHKVVVFDLDETIGNFADLYLIWKAIFAQRIFCGTPDPKITQSIFNELLDLYPEFLRYGILDILDFLRTKIQNGESHRIYLYTNNQCEFVASPDSRDTLQPSPTEWVEMIIVYLNLKINATDTIFAKPICAFKINNKIIEPLRETTSKTHRDFLKCALLPKNTEICFIDDVYHARMIHNRVYYVQPPPYTHGLSNDMIIDRFMNSALYFKLNKNGISISYTILSYDGIPSTDNIPKPTTYAPGSSLLAISKSRIEIHKDIYAKLMYYIKEFFCITTRSSNTRRKKTRFGKFTRKKRMH